MVHDASPVAPSAWSVSVSVSPVGCYVHEYVYIVAPAALPAGCYVYAGYYALYGDLNGELDR